MRTGLRMLIGALCVGAVHAESVDKDEKKALVKVPAVVQVKDVPPKKDVFTKSSATKPLVLKTRKEAAKVFDKEALAKLEKKVNFKHQIVLVFAWRGSGRDDLLLGVEESYPESVHFDYERGRTRDLRPHIKVYALRNNVTWKAK